MTELSPIPKLPWLEEPPVWFVLNHQQTNKYYDDVLNALTSESDKDEARRQFASQDLYYLLTRVLGRKSVNHKWLFKRCRQVQLDPFNKLYLWAREHYKTTIISYGLMILLIINNPEITIGIFSHTRTIAKTFLSQIKETLEANDELKRLFPEIFYRHPENQSPKWSLNDGIIVKRQNVSNMATVEAWGIVDSQPTSKHFSVRLYDDLVSEESVGTPEQIEKTTKRWENSNNLGMEGGVELYVGTRYHLYDTYHEIIEREIVTQDVRPCTKDGSEDFSKAVLQSPDWLAQKRKKQGPYTFSAQMLLKPVPDSLQSFKEEWLSYWPNDSHDGLNKIILVDAANSKKRTADYTSMWVVGLGADNHYRVCDIVRDRLNLAERTRMVFHLVQKWDCDLVGYESIGLDSDTQHIKLEMDRLKYNFTLLELPAASNTSKNDRIKRLIPIFESKRLHLPTSLIRQDYEHKAVDLVSVFKKQEYMAFPVPKHDDMMDALSRLMDEEVLNSFTKPVAPQRVQTDLIANYKREQRRRLGYMAG